MDKYKVPKKITLILGSEITGIENNISLGSPIAFFVKNENFRKEDYKELEDLFRPSHADLTYFRKFGSNLPVEFFCHLHSHQAIIFLKKWK